MFASTCTCWVLPRNTNIMYRHVTCADICYNATVCTCLLSRFWTMVGYVGFVKQVSFVRQTSSTRSGCQIWTVAMLNACSLPPWERTAITNSWQRHHNAAKTTRIWLTPASPRQAVWRISWQWNVHVQSPVMLWSPQISQTNILGV